MSHLEIDGICYYLSMELPKVIISDADGTLVDTLHLIRHGQYTTTTQFLASHKVTPADIPDFDTFQAILANTVGGSARHTLEQTVRKIYEKTPHRLEGMDFEDLHDRLNPIQDQLAPEFVKPYEGLSRFFSFLGSTGIKLGIFTSGTPHHVVWNFGIALPELGLSELFKDTTQLDAVKLEKFISTALRFYNLSDFTIITCEDTAAHKPDPESIQLAMQRLGTTPKKSLVLGDHRVDMQAGVNAGVQQRIGITHGFGSKEALIQAGATNTVDSLYEFMEKLQS